MNLRIADGGRAVTEGAQVEIGGNDRYLPMCRRHFKEAVASA
jgi:thymidine kinase